MGGGLPAPDGGNAGYDPQRLLRPLLQGHGQEAAQHHQVQQGEHDRVEDPSLPGREEARGDRAAGYPQLAERHSGRAHLQRGLHYRDSYLRSINNQLNAISNHAERYYNLEKNPVHKVDKMGSKEAGEMQFWTKEEHLRFSDASPTSRLSFMRSKFSAGWAYDAASSWRSRPRTSCWKRPSFA